MKLATALLAFALAASAQPVEVVLATYGAGQLHDVTNTIRNALSSGKREIPVTLDALGVGDPSPGRVKVLRIVYRFNGSLYEVMGNDFDTVTLPTGAPASTASASQPAAGGTTLQPTTGGFFDTPGASNPAAGTAGASASSAGASVTTPAAAPVSVSPVASVPNGACFYTQANYSGSPYCFASGSTTATLGDQRRRFRSVRLVGSAKSAWLFDADNFTGASIRLMQSQANLRTAQGPYYMEDFEDRAASLRVE